MTFARRSTKRRARTWKTRRQAILADLAELHQLLESARIGEEDFDRRETMLLDRLEARAEGRTPRIGPA